MHHDRARSHAMRRWILLIAGALVALGGCVAPRAPAPEPLRVMTYNIRHGAGMDGVVDLGRIAAVITAARPDVVALQEVDAGTNRTGRIDQAATLARLTGLEHHAFGAFMDYDGGQYGMAVLSRHPIAASRVIDLPPGRHEPRTALRADVSRPNGAFIIVGVHLDWLDDDTDRFAQASALAGALAAETGPVIVAGDFNDVPGSRTIDLLDGRWTRIAKPDDATSTFPSPTPEREIDFIYIHAPGGHSGARAWVIDERLASDHRPVVAEVDW